jgi:peptide/nickel transport system substrate-binding protein
MAGLKSKTRRQVTALLIFLLIVSGCVKRPTPNPNVIVVSLNVSPNNLDPRFALDDASQKIGDLIFDPLMMLDDNMRVVPRLAERLDHPDPLTYIATLRRGVMFHDGHELTSADVTFTYNSLIDPQSTSPRRGGYRELASVTATDRYTVTFTLKQPFISFPVNLVAMPIIPDGAVAPISAHPVGTGAYRFVRYDVDDRVELAPFEQYFGGRPRNEGIILKIIPDDVMRGLELRKGTVDIVVNDLAPDIVDQLKSDERMQIVEGPGVDYQYVGLNLRDPILKDVRIRQALAYAVDRQAIVEYLRRGLARPAIGLMPSLSWAFAPDAFSFPYDPEKAKALLDQAGYPDPDGSGPGIRFRLSLKVSNLEFNRLQSAVLQENFRDVGIELDVRLYEQPTLFADVLRGNFQLYTLIWTAGSVADPDMLRRVFHSGQIPPNGFNRGYFSDPDVDRLLDEATTSADPARRLALFQEVQRRVAVQVPYISLWNRTNFAVGGRSLEGLRVTPLGDLKFLKDVARTRPVDSN